MRRDSAADDLRRPITHRLPLSRVSEAFETAAAKSTGSVKVSVTP